MLRLMMRRLHRQEEGFTLIELLVVIAIVALLAAVAAPKLYKAMESARKVNGQADLQTVANALDRYNFDKDAYPATASVKAGLEAGYVKNNFAWQNGYSYPYGYASDGSTYYILIDTENLGAGTYTGTCGTATVTFTQLAKDSAGPVAATIGGTGTPSTCTTWKDASNNAVTIKYITNN